ESTGVGVPVVMAMVTVRVPGFWRCTGRIRLVVVMTVLGFRGIVHLRAGVHNFRRRRKNRRSDVEHAPVAHGRPLPVRSAALGLRRERAPDGENADQGKDHERKPEDVGDIRQRDLSYLFELSRALRVTFSVISLPSRMSVTSTTSPGFWE